MTREGANSYPNVPSESNLGLFASQPDPVVRSLAFEADAMVTGPAPFSIGESINANVSRYILTTSAPARAIDQRRPANDEPLERTLALVASQRRGNELILRGCERREHGNKANHAQRPTTITFQRVDLKDPFDEQGPTFSKGGTLFWRELGLGC